jgi:hypothetical protein
MALFRGAVLPILSHHPVNARRGGVVGYPWLRAGQYPPLPFWEGGGVVGSDGKQSKEPLGKHHAMALWGSNTHFAPAPRPVRRGGNDESASCDELTVKAIEIVG